jgi:tetratricopeptide (TPR) repeat protein
MLVPPFSRSVWSDPQRPVQHRSSEIAVPFSFLPWFYSRQYQDGTGTQSRSSWFFPFYKRTVEQSPERNVKKVSILWPLWNGEWEQGETRIRGLGGTVNYFERDVNRFVEQRILYRFFTRRTRSWFAERELMPFYSSQTREDGNAYWKILGGLVGREVRDGRTYLRLLFVPIPTGAARPSGSGSGAEQQAVHADLALNYLRHGRYDRAAIEFTLAGSVRDDDLAFQMAAASAYLDADPETIGKELRSSVPSSLEPMTGKGRRDRRTLLTNLRQMAVQRFEVAIALGGDAPGISRQMALAYGDMGMHEKALEALTAGASLRPSFALAMQRLAILGVLGWDHHTDRFEPTGSRQEPVRSDMLEWRRQWMALLAEMRRDYPSSPALCRIEAEGPASENDDAYGGWSSYRHGFRTGDLFSADTLRRLALFERGAMLKSDAEELAWMAGDAGGRHRRLGVASLPVWHRWMGDGDSDAPARACATQAITLLNRQAEWALERKEYGTLDPLFKRILALLPHACVQCDSTGSDTAPSAARMTGDGPVSDSMQRLHRYYVIVREDPVAYIALAEDWSARLCPHQQVAIEQSLKPLRLELQYLKAWRITGLDKTQNYRGAFFDRYVDLDTILGHPDRCAVTAECLIVVPTARDAVLRLGFDHRLKAELNGKEIFREKKRKIAVRDEFTVPVALLAGENHLVLSITDDKLAYGFFARLSDKDGLTMKDADIRVPDHE